MAERNLGFLKRAWRVIKGFGDALEAIPGLFKDLAIAPWKDEREFNGIVPSLYYAIKRRGGQLLGNIFGPTEGLGALFGGLPEGVRKPVRSVTEPVFKGLETAYQEGVAEPITTYFTAFSLASPEARQGGTGIGAIFNPDTWSRAYKIAQSRTPGQALALTFLTKDITDPVEVAAAQRGRAYEIISGTGDAVSRIFLDPTVVGGKIAKVKLAKMRKVRPGDSPAQIVKDSRVQATLDAVEKRVDPKTGAAKIRADIFPDHQYGAELSQLMNEAPDRAARELVMRGAFGDVGVMSDWLDGNEWLADRMGVLYGDQFMNLMSTTPDPLTIKPLVYKALEQEIDRLGIEQARFQRAAGVFQAFGDEVPRVRMVDKARHAITSTDFWRSDRWPSRAMRSVYAMRPERLINVHDVEMADVQVARWLDLSRVDIDTQLLHRSRFLAATNEAEKLQALEMMENDVVQKMLAGAKEQKGSRLLGTKGGPLKVEEADNILAKAARLRGNAKRLMGKSRAYEGKSVTTYTYPDEFGLVNKVSLRNVPISETQQLNLYALPDLDRLKMTTRTWGRWRLTHPGSDIPKEILEMFQHVWVPSVLLRVGWPIRIATDEQLRILALLGVMSDPKALGAQLKHLQGITGEAVSYWKQGFGIPFLRRVPGVRKLPGIRGKVDAEDYLLGARKTIVEGFEFSGPFGATPGDARELWLGLNSAGRAQNVMWGQTVSGNYNKLKQRTGEWQTQIDTSDFPNYGESWADALNKQVAQDAMWRQFLEGKSVDQVVEWAYTTSRGQAYLRGNKIRSRNVTEWAKTQKEIVDDLTVHNVDLQDKALKRQVTYDDLVKVVPDATHRPPVNGAVIAENTGKSQTFRSMQKFLDKGMDFLGRAPTDFLARNPFFGRLYEAELTRMVDNLERQGTKHFLLDEKMVNQMEEAASRRALHYSRRYLYDVAERSQFAHAARFFMPFFMPYQEFFSVWFKIGIQNPTFVARARLIWNAPEKAGIIRDERGNRIDENGNAFDPIDGSKVEAGEQRLVVFRLPEWAHKIPGMSKVPKGGNIAFSKKGINLFLQGTPGFGPLVQIPVNEIVKARPDIEDAVKFMLPFGTTQDTASLFFPAWARRLKSRAAGAEEDRVYFNTAIRIYMDSVVDTNLGRRDSPLEWGEAQRQANALYNLRTFASFVSPTVASFQSPYQLYIDAFRAARERYGKDESSLADEEGNARTPELWFLDTYGSEYFALTQSLSRSMDGVPPTLEGASARRKYQKLIEKYPDLGNLIVGKEGAGRFHRAVYDAQLEKELRPGAGVKQRERPSFEEIQASSGVRQGWIKFERVMDLIDYEMNKRGLPNLRVKEARDLQAVKKALVASIAQEFPEWQKEYLQVDLTKQENRRDGFREIVKDKRLFGRPEIQGLKVYLDTRDAVVKELRRRKYSTLEAKANQDLSLLWESSVAAIREKNVLFGSLWARWLENDVVTARDKVAA